MLILLNLPEERTASSVWEIPILVSPERLRVKKALFIANHSIWARGGVCRLSLLNRKNDEVIGFLAIEDDLNAFEPLGFELFDGWVLAPGDVLTLTKEPTRERNIALPFCLTQVELE